MSEQHILSVEEENDFARRRAAEREAQAKGSSRVALDCHAKLVPMRSDTMLDSVRYNR